MDFGGGVFAPLENAVRKMYSKSYWLLYEIRIFELKYVNRTVIKAVYCTFTYASFARSHNSLSYSHYA